MTGQGRVARFPPRQRDASRQRDGIADGKTLNSTVMGPSRDLYLATAIINSHLLISPASHYTFTRALKRRKQLIRRKKKKGKKTK